MSRSDDAARSPAKKQSQSSLLAAFRSLTGGRSSQPSSAVSPATTAVTSSAYTSSPSISSPLVSPAPNGNGLFAPIERPPTYDSNPGFTVDATPRSPQVAGPANLQTVLPRLHSSNPEKTRILAAKKIVGLLRLYTGADVVAVWTIGQDLVDYNAGLESIRAGYELLDSCVRHKTTLEPQEKRLFFDAVAQRSHKQTFSSQFRALASLTENGKNIEDIEQGFVRLLVRLLSGIYDAYESARRSKNQIDERENLDKMFNFVLDALKSNAKIFTEDDLSLMIRTVCDLSARAHEGSDVIKSIQIVDAMIIYSCLPRSSLVLCVELLCKSYCIPEDTVTETAWSAMKHLLDSHLGPATISILMTTLKDATGHENQNEPRGAALLLATIIKTSDVTGPATIQLPKLVSAARQSLEVDSNRLEQAVLGLLLQLCRADDAAVNVFHEKIWSNVSDVLLHCSERVPQGILHRVDFLSLTDGGSGKLARDYPKNVAKTVELLRDVAGCLLRLTEDNNPEQRVLVMRLLMRIAVHLKDSQATILVDYLASECLLYAMSEHWQADFEGLLNCVFKDYARSVKIRRQAFRALAEGYGTSEALEIAGTSDLLMRLLGCVGQETDVNVTQDLCELAVTIGSTTADPRLFTSIVQCLKTALLQNEAPTITASSPTLPNLAQRLASGDKPVETINTHLARALVRILLRCVNRTTGKCLELYKILLSIARSSDSSADARVVALKLLFRLRADTYFGIFFIPLTECDDIAAALCRTAETVMESTKQLESPMIRASRPDEQVARRSGPQSSSPLPKSSSRTSLSNTKSPPGTSRDVKKITPPLWLYPGPKGLPEEPPATASHLLTSRAIDEDSAADGKAEMKMGAWLEVVLEILQQDEVEWEVYSYALVHLGAQLTNQALFVDAIPQIQLLRSVVCGQIINKNFHEPPPFTNLRKSDVAICMYHILTMLISYRKHFSKNEQDDMVKVFVAGIGSWDRTSEVCIHALSICCHELPASLTKVLENALGKMSHVITQSHLAVHILEFLAALARLPDLYKNFRDEDFKIVFGICFRYLQYVREAVSKSNDPPTNRVSAVNVRPSSSAKEGGYLKAVVDTNPTMSDELPQYVYVLTYHVMVFWFVSFKIEERNKHIPWIVKNLVFTDADGREVIEEQAQVTMDLMRRVEHSVRHDTGYNKDFANDSDGPRTIKSWIVGMSLVTVETARDSGLSQVTRRMPSGTEYSVLSPQLSTPPRHQDPLVTASAVDENEEDGLKITPDYILAKFHSQAVWIPGMSPFESPIPLPEDDATRRALSSFDRISALDGHKVGIIYVGEAQTEEASILSNVMGSADYTYFLRGIGKLCALRDANFNTQGLDRSEMETDGKFTFAWRDQVSELVFHITTMMPTRDDDPQCNYKKLHIGNDFVNIIFNNSGHSWDMETIPSAFNYVNIVVTPEARASFVETRLAASVATDDPTQSKNPFNELYYKVTVLTKPGIPAISPAASTKIISGASLPAFVRLLSLNASVFCSFWSNRESAGGSGEVVSSWRSRLREIVKLRERYGPKPAEGEQGSEQRHSTSTTGSGNRVTSLTARGETANAPSNASTGFKDSASGRESAVFRRQSKANIFTGSTSNATDAPGNRGSGFSAGGADMERTSSAGSGKM